MNVDFGLGGGRATPFRALYTVFPRAQAVALTLVFFSIPVFLNAVHSRASGGEELPSTMDGISQHLHRSKLWWVHALGDRHGDRGLRVPGLRVAPSVDHGDLRVGFVAFECAVICQTSRVLSLPRGLLRRAHLRARKMPAASRVISYRIAY